MNAQQKQEIINKTLKTQEAHLKNHHLLESDLCYIEFLPIAILKENFDDFSACENKWRMLSEITDIHPLELVKSRFSAMRKIVEENYPDKYYPIYEEKVFINQLLLGKTIEDMMTIYRIHTDEKKCPLCGASILRGSYSISRKDNETLICSDCGLNEALEDLEDYRE